MLTFSLFLLLFITAYKYSVNQATKGKTPYIGSLGVTVTSNKCACSTNWEADGDSKCVVSSGVCSLPKLYCFSQRIIFVCKVLFHIQTIEPLVDSVRLFGRFAIRSLCRYVQKSLARSARISQ